MIRKFEYTDGHGVKREANAYTVDSFISENIGVEGPVKTTASGTIHPSLMPSGLTAKAASVVITRTASTEILVGDLVYPSANGSIGVADNNDTLHRAKVLGISLSNAQMGEDVDVLLLGVIYSTDFSVFGILDPLFLDSEGAITNDKPTSSVKYLVQIGKSLGGNEILIDIKDPIVVGG